jgi:enamine deaminase RidA (YjgF/YER057c/UK114 family)
VSVYEILRSLDIVLPEVEPPVAAFLPFLRSGNHVYLSGHIAKVNGGAPRTGKLGAGLTTEEGKSAARDVAVDLLGTLHAAVGDLNRVRHIVKLMVLVNSDPSFTEQSIVANGASELFIKVFGQQGKHARSAFGVAQLPAGTCVEIELIAEVA